MESIHYLSYTATGIARGTGIIPGGKVGADHAIFKQGASAGNVGNMKLLEQKKANPIALLLSSAMRLRHLQFPSFADRLDLIMGFVTYFGLSRARSSADLVGLFRGC